MDNTPPTYEDLAAWNNDLRMKVQALRRQLAKMQDTIASRTSNADALRGVLSACRETLGADDNAALYDACAEAADLRRQLHNSELHTVMMIAVHDTLEAENATLHRQLAEARAQLAQRDAARTADAEDYPPAE